MQRYKITFSSLKDDIKKFKKIKVHVIGDTIIDTHTKTSLIGGYLKSPTPSVLYNDVKDYTGGAAIVAKHLKKKAGAEVCFTTILGEDKLKKFCYQGNEKSKNKIKCYYRPNKKYNK